MISASSRRYRATAAGFVAIGLVSLLFGCREIPSAPSNRSLNSGTEPNRSTAPLALVKAQALIRSKVLTRDVVVVQTIQSGGGVIDVPGADFQLQVPSGAFVGDSITITITAYAGNVVAYDFEPHGDVFLQPLQAVQQLSHTNWKSVKLPKGFYPNWAGAFFADSTQIDFKTGRALINEFMPGGVDVAGLTMTWSVPHFSGYMVSTGQEDQ